MDSDDLFGSSVWASSSNTPATETSSRDEIPFSTVDAPAASTSDHGGDGFDDFDDFNEPTAAGGQVQDAGSAPFNAPSTIVAEPESAWGSEWHPLRLEPLPPLSELTDRVNELLAPIYDPEHTSRFLTDESIRQAEGLNQTLATAESRALFQTIFATYPPSTRPPDWIRSRIRRQHLISLGIPINLDEILPQSSIKQMPELQITTRPASTPPGGPGSRQRTSTAPPSRSGTPTPGGRSQPQSAAQLLSIGPKPSLNKDRIAAMLALEHDKLSLLPLAEVQAHLASLRRLTADASAQLTHVLQTKDALQQDSETYNGLIGELVGEATRAKTAQQRGRSSSKRSSAFS
ncbi:hypothetical protein BKA62DRAFT_689694 [Auriculariales sp. MPI-PUGE-AT-0066]|nr:hypothetical protein BKA62DRAFT_689694 [Auriculariales sp. MPI-PUGE-AT-0066]